MKFLIALLFILTAAVGLSLLAGSNDGYVLIVQPPYRIEISLNLLIVLLAVGFFFLHGILRLVQYTLRLPGSVRNYKREQRRKQALTALLDSLHALIEGRYAKAEKAAAHALELGGDPGLSTFVAARAAHKMQLYGKRDYYLAEAERLAPAAAVGRLLTQAELLLDERLYPQALRVLQQVDKIEPHHIPVLTLLLKVQQRLGNWEQVLAVLAQLEKRAAITPLHLQQTRFHAYQQLLERLAHDPAALLAYWNKIPENERLDTPLACVGARLLAEAGAGEAAAKAVEMSLTRQWDSKLAALYGDCSSEDPLRQLQQAEFWLQAHHGDAGLLLALGNLCLRQELWGKAQSYLEASISVQPSSRAHLALARLLERLGQQEDAYRHYRLSLEYALE